LFDKEHRLQTAFSDAEANAYVAAWGISNTELENCSTESLIENVFNCWALDPVEVKFEYIWKTTVVSPSYMTETSSYVETTLHAKCNESATYIGDLTKTFVRGVASRNSSNWEISRIYNAKSVADDPQLIAGYRAEFVADIRADAAECNTKICDHRGHLHGLISSIITDRVQQLRSSNEAARAADIHLTPLPDPINIPLVPKSLTLATVEKRHAAGAPSARLADEIADQLVSTLRSFASAVGRQPVLSAEMLSKNEEPLRDILVYILSSQWGGAASAETFVGEGKTDILLRYKDANAFIGECKMWRGQAAFTKGINQLLGYTVWDDTRAGIILFIRGMADVKAVVATAAKCIREHPNFVDEGDGQNEFVIYSKHDAHRNIRLSLIPVHIPGTAPEQIAVDD
jgi:hypothetical protein